jgi:uncharacterized protein YegJ (DUF2314 family)
MNWIDDETPEMARAIRLAHETFPEFQRHVDMECFRVVPAFHSIFVKVYVTDTSGSQGEHVFISSPVISKSTIAGELASEPQVINDLNENIEVAHDRLSDWFLEVNGIGAGGFTVEVLKKGIPPEHLESYCAYPPVSWYNHRTKPAAEELQDYPMCATCGERDFIGPIALRKSVPCSFCHHEFKRLNCTSCGVPIMRHPPQPRTCAHCTAQHQTEQAS